MASPPPPGAHSGVINNDMAHTAADNAGAPPMPFTRPFTLIEALPFSPFTSVAPFYSGIVPNPTLGSGFTSVGISEQVSRHEYDNLNQDAAQNHSMSKRTDHAVHQVQQVLNSNVTKPFTFLKGPKTSANGPSGPSLASKLSPFAKLVYDKTNVSFRYSPPDNNAALGLNGVKSPAVLASASPSMPPKKKRKSSGVNIKSEHQKPDVLAAANKTAHSRNNATIEISIPSQSMRDSITVTPVKLEEPATVTARFTTERSWHSDDAHPKIKGHSPDSVDPRQDAAQATRTHENQDELQRDVSDPSSHSSAAQRPRESLQVNIPLVEVKDKDKYHDYKDYVEPPAILSHPKISQNTFDDAHYDLDVNQREKSDAAFRDLRRHLSDVFAAERKLVNQSTPNQHVFLVSEDTPTMTIAAQQKSHNLIEKTIDLRSFADAPLNELLHVQKLSDGALRFAEGLDIKLDDSWGEEDVLAWIAQLPNVDLGLKAARTSLRIMAGGREDRQLYSEDTIQMAVNIFKNTMDSVVVPITELRQSGPTQKLFSLLVPHKKAITGVFTSCQRLYLLMSSLISTIDLSETVTSTLEYLSTHLMFVENASSERESLVGVQKFDGLRMVAMDMVSQIFVMNPAQRQGIFNDLLTSLEKLPIGKHSARQYKLLDGASIQPVSALIMRLVQSSAGRVDTSKSRAKPIVTSEEDEDGEGEEDPNTRHGRLGTFTSGILSEEESAQQPDLAMHELKDVGAPLAETARHNAAYVINFIVSRALRSTKTGDSPYRNLLDLFVDDFVTCLDSTDWPAAEVLLRQLTFQMISQIEAERTPAPAKNMALEILGVMCAAITKLTSQLRKVVAQLSTEVDDPLSYKLADLAATSTTAAADKAGLDQLSDWSGPHRAILEYLESRVKADPHLQSAISLIVAQWAQLLATVGSELMDNNNSQPVSPEMEEELGRLAFRLRMMVQDSTWISTKYTFPKVSAHQARASYIMVIQQLQLCKLLPRMLHILVNSMTSDQATVKSKSLRSINQVIETDPTLLDGESPVVRMILFNLEDGSPQVRDSALALIGKCIALRPSMETEMAAHVVDRFQDNGLGVRKRAMKLAKEIYLRRTDGRIRSQISSALLFRVAMDQDEGIRDLARQTIEETWIFPFYNTESTAEDKTSLAEHISLMVTTVRSHNAAGRSLETVLRTVLSPGYKTVTQNSKACRKLVAGMFDLVATTGAGSGDSSGPAAKEILQVLVIFAGANPSLFDFEQIRLLKPQVTTIAKNMSAEDMALARPVIGIYRKVLPQLSAQHHAQFLEEIRAKLLPAVASIEGNDLLDDVIACIWIISVVTGVSKQLAALAISALAGLRGLQKTTTFALGPLSKTQRYAQILGLIGKHCELDPHRELFRAKLGDFKGSTSKVMVDIIIPFTKSGKPKEVRTFALNAIGKICQNHPRNYVSANVYQAFQQAFDEREAELEQIVMTSLREFLIKEERRSEQASQDEKASGVKKGGVSKKELTTMGGTNYDDVASATTQRFLKDLTRIALATIDSQAFLAVEVLSSITRQGLVHPKETGVTMMTLETCPRSDISDLAYQAHKLLHEKHESVLEREYAKALQSVFQYQRDKIKDARGALHVKDETFVSKMHLMMELLGISKTKNRQGFLKKLCSLIDFDPTKLNLDDGQPLPHHVEFSRFLVENLAFFDYATVGELQLAINSLERLVTGRGADIAQSIESDIFQIRIDDAAPGRDDATAPPGAFPGVDDGSGASRTSFFAAPADLAHLRRLTAGSMILTAAWETRTYLRRQYGLRAERRPAEGKGKPLAKDLSKTPTRVQTVTGNKLWEDFDLTMSALSSQEQMMSQCRRFVELLNVDSDFKVADNDDDDEMMNGDGPATPSADEDEDDDAPDSGGARGRKRKAPGTPGGRKKRPRSNSQPRKRGRPRKNPLPAARDEGDGDIW
ncbi:hypothetical protein MCOR29_011561 [Pyricularia oryzae]|nr:hypothetical protein MCOR19_005509 [Pyricularia oryzae]KAI6293763.1 hypothetical protein MCOR29_011561 [Pyricularia oryzae]KAI6396063.1 hypothetical protein MCOR23_006831 [Pyricularia oryzae]KAI6404340.1 hypothetical protein MCOR20_006965 [Pyricularia oryzae]KAI6427533.1 hypothetical protein MCOR22_010656 [Pyricularia oryzae]